MYFSVTVFTTVGFGDITAKSETARIVLIVQMLADLALLGAGARALLGQCAAASNEDPVPVTAPAPPSVTASPHSGPAGSASPESSLRPEGIPVPRHTITGLHIRRNSANGGMQGTGQQAER
jgi:hypothetical protein